MTVQDLTRISSAETTTAQDGAAILDVRDLRTYFYTDEGVVRAVDGISYSVPPGETLGIVGESGSGKTVAALSLMRLIEDPARIVSGAINFDGRDVVTMADEDLRKIRGGGIAMVFQDPMTSLNPVLKIARQLVETMVVHGKLTEEQALDRAIKLLGRMGITAPERAVDSYPHQFSGGMRQRVMLAMGFSNEPQLLIADEPTTALDVTIQAQILELIVELNRDFKTAIVLISHNLGVIASVCSRVVVMYAGEIVEEGPTEKILADPRHPYTWALINAVPRIDRHVPGQRRLVTIEGTPPDPLNMPTGCRFATRCPFRIEKCEQHPELVEIAPERKSRCWVTQAGQDLPPPQTSRSAPGETKVHAGVEHGETVIKRGERMLELRNVVKHFPLPKTTLFGQQKWVHAINGVSLDIAQGETVGLVGESGCGKSTLARVVARIHEPTSGSVLFHGQDIAHASQAQIRPLRRRMQMVFQDPYASLNPRMTVGDILGEPLRFHEVTKNDKETRERIAELLDVVGLTPKAAGRYPHEFSGGQRQRISIARALSVRPDFIIADEPISALDVNIQAQIINLLIDLQERFGLTYLFIAHDLAVVRHISDRVVVLYLGSVMEIAPADTLFAEPLHPYTRYLISAVPIPDATIEAARARLPLQGEPPSTVDAPSGCPFRTRCPIAQGICAQVMPPVTEVRPSHFVACHFPGQF